VSWNLAKTPPLLWFSYATRNFSIYLAKTQREVITHGLPTGFAQYKAAREANSIHQNDGPSDLHLGKRKDKSSIEEANYKSLDIETLIEKKWKKSKEGVIF
jgi:hypothetical protein